VRFIGDFPPFLHKDSASYGNKGCELSLVSV